MYLILKGLWKWKKVFRSFDYSIVLKKTLNKKR